MFEKILQKLKQHREKGSNVSDRSLEDLARTMETVITTDELLEKWNPSAAIKSIDGNINHTSAEAAKKAAEEAARQAAEKANNTPPATPSTTDPKDKDDVPAWAKQLMEQNSKLTERLDAMSTEKVSTTRKGKLEKALNGLPEFYTKPIMSAFDRAKFDSEEAFNEYLAEITTNKEAFEQTAKEKGYTFSIPPRQIEHKEETGETSALSSAREVLKKQKEQQEKK